MKVQKKSDMLKHHSLNFLEMALRTDRIGKVKNPDGYGVKTGECGDTVEFFLVCRENCLSSVSFYSVGCVNTNACCNTVAKFAQGRTIDEAWEIEPDHVADFLETLPENHFHCAVLAVGALYRALADIEAKKLRY